MGQVVLDTDEYSKTFYVHKDLISYRSHFFAKALKTYGEDGDSLWREGKDGAVELSEDDPEAFENYIQLIYQDLAPIGKAPESDINTIHHPQRQSGIQCAKQAYVWCDKVRDHKGKNTLIAAFIEPSSKTRENKRKYFPTVASVKIVYEGTMDSDPLRNFSLTATCYLDTRGGVLTLNLNIMTIGSSSISWLL
ncbi:hypothetical protein CC86DRAFT_290487 [Ophiobolus disseminans]|uniref:BTB domain-containing protein n=1 Tax=Ophiobolus disseminans TaxID=1469910 RepID=A0A6A7A315_9PLEO|nr:hypothetical protein CC86DRAFT_290487 [Ophiobolus disseminans]